MTVKPAPNTAFPLPTPPESVSDVDTEADDELSPLPPPPPRSISSVWLPVPASNAHAATTNEKPRPSSSRPPDIPLPPPDKPGFYLAPPSPRLPLPPTPTHATGLTYAYSRSRRWRKFLHSEPAWLLLYFLFNLSLTLYNKIVLVRFPFPYTLTALHAFSGTIGSYLAMEMGYFTPSRLTARESMLLTAFSFLYTINIAVSNLSLQLVTVPFHQVVRAATPLFIIALSYFLLSTSHSSTKLLSLVPVIVGVGFATYGDYYFTLWGLILTLLGTILAALKTIVTHLLQTGQDTSSRSVRRSRIARIIPTRLLPTRPLKLHPLDLLLRMSPLAFIQCVMYAHLSGELDRVRAFGAQQMDRQKAAALAVNGIMAFGLNVVSFTANSKVGPLSITVAANVKQVLTILLAVSIFDLHITRTNGIGITLTIFGGTWYAAVEYREKKRKREILSLTSPNSPR